MTAYTALQIYKENTKEYNLYIVIIYFSCKNIIQKVQAKAEKILTSLAYTFLLQYTFPLWTTRRQDTVKSYFSVLLNL